ncbi:LD-carboxypeptidase [[Phormidium ambiguum] IAM M-71]|uniref:LD-carboxypeptidase n=1 Tax=[Phormidium ambiguum] IAM M-71 TaxID=454136 RepID=A0A1U7IJ02_9CYAN|nr:LD-carboxypeptidase [Phormidium ambiguum]OKH37078.1 LD-carboxypeptidase [Phormidium ambiguum IAM M-71]
MIFPRRQILQVLGLATLTSQLPKIAQANSFSQPILKPHSLKIGDTIGLVNPASFITSADLEEVKETLTDIGLKYKLGAHILDRYGYLAGKDIDRAADINAMFVDPSVKAILTLRGGWGCNRILPLLNYQLIRKNPKIIIGYSDITSLLLAIYSLSGIITFHGPVATSTWNQFTKDYVQRILFNGEAVTMQNSVNTGENINAKPIQIETITPGKARGKLIGGNLSVLSAMVGSAYLPNWQGSILFLEEIGEEVYRVDRMLTQLKLAGILDRISGFIFGQCTRCDPEKPEQSLTLMQVLQDHIQPLKIPAWYGAAIGHIPNKFTLPIGLEVEIDANNGSIQMLESATESK